jgi:hypothetical protein
MAQHSSPSDYSVINPNYTLGEGYYTNDSLVADLLQIPDFTGSTNPTNSQIGEYIKRVESYIDIKTANSFRPLLFEDEVHDFQFTGRTYSNRYYHDYVGFVQLDRPNIRKVLRLEVWQGNHWKNLASASASITVGTYSDVVTASGLETTITLTLPNSGLAFDLEAGTLSSRWNTSYGNKTAAQEIVSLINEMFPHDTATITNATSSKALQDNAGSPTRNISDFFYATVDSEDNTKVIVTSKLLGEDGANCSISVSSSSEGISVGAFTDEEEMKRMGDWWSINNEGRVFFRTNFPYSENNSIKVTYIAGEARVSGVICDAATKLVACEVLRADDQTVLIAETGANIDIKAKYDLLKQEAEELINICKETVFFLE